mmetsp:Transcript_10893/g.33397  ORF Transcript_10893/g.33397 Transcript_10893/m.33397 type:complete len:291 (-) Transcript_10893:176-1048(-)
MEESMSYSCPASPSSLESMATQRPMNVVVTGGSSGIGRSLVTQFAEQGHRVLFSYLSNERGAAQLEQQYATVTARHLDQGSVESVQKFGKEVEEWLNKSQLAHLDVLINNAALGSATVRGYCGDNASSFMHDEALMRVNALGPLWVTQTLLPLRESQERSVVIFVGSVGGGSSAVFPEYHASDLMSKSAVSYLSKHLAAEHVHTEIDIFCVSPGATETEMFRQSTLNRMSNPKAFVKGMPKSELIQPEDVAANLYYLATSPASRMFHGAVIDASMGLAVRPGLQTEARVS